MTVSSPDVYKRQGLQSGKVERAGLGVEPQNRNQKRSGGDEGEEEELERGLGTRCV